jgi:hypothetical protein
MNDERQSLIHNTPRQKNPPTMVRVTYLSHALFGQQFEFVRLRKGNEPCVEVLLPSGRTTRLPVDYTDFSTPTDSIDHEKEDVNLLEINGLLSVVKLISAVESKKQLKKDEINIPPNRMNVRDGETF